ncbi:RNA polymerase sigma factor [Caulobacter sp.]|uniref:RNA polymerase sigma factor n=1 Tax=Caulobacter sp. TaxID=78 RepID=UPI003BAEEE91
MTLRADPKVVFWVSQHILPYETKVRQSLARARVPETDIDDLLQEAYCRLCTLRSVEHIDSPEGYLFRTVRNVLNAQIRRRQIVRIDFVTAMDLLAYADEYPSPEEETSYRRYLSHVREAMLSLPERCRRILEMRKIEGLSQREIARKINVSESIVENEGAKGMRLITQALRDRHGEDAPEIQWRRQARD